MAESISSSMCDDFKVKSKLTEDNEAIDLRAKIVSALYQLLEEKIEIGEIKLLLKDNETLINTPLETTGPLAGYTALHMACIRYREFLVSAFVRHFNADVNIVAEDGAQPIHLACMFRVDHFKCFDDICDLLNAHANIEAEIGRNVFEKHKKGKVWCSDFGDKMTLLTFAILYERPELAYYLLRKKANLKIISNANKTLLMYALEKNLYDTARYMLYFTEDPKDFDIRDDEGYCAIHYIYHPKKYGDYRYDFTQSTSEGDIYHLIRCPKTFTDIYATINGNPDTLLLNMAAYRNSYMAIKVLLPLYDNIEKSKALYLATLPLEDPQKFLHFNEPYTNQTYYIEMVKEQLNETISAIITDLINRLAFGLHVPIQEKQLMDKMLAADKDMKKIFDDYQKNYINVTLKSTQIKYGDKCITYYDLISLKTKDKKLQVLVRDERFIEAHANLEEDFHDDDCYFWYLTLKRIQWARERNPLLDKLKTIKQLKAAIPLPYECILDMIEFLDNEDLKIFVNSFFTS